jgi:thioredoxin reductase
VPTQAVLLATGICDQLPSIPGIQECYGISVHHCPYCDGWEHRDSRWPSSAAAQAPCGLSLSLKTWTSRVTLCTNGWAPTRQQREQLAAHDVSIRTSACWPRPSRRPRARVQLAGGDR